MISAPVINLVKQALAQLLPLSQANATDAAKATPMQACVGQLQHILQYQRRWSDQQVYRYFQAVQLADATAMQVIQKTHDQVQAIVAPNHASFHELNHDSDFADLAQVAVEKYYLAPFPGEADKRLAGHFNRKTHGAVHVCLSALTLEMLYAVVQQSLPTKFDPLDASDLKLLKLAMVYHDSANQNDFSGGNITEADHAANFERDMLAYGFAPDKVKRTATAMAEKELHPNASLLHILIHDADCLEVMRVRVHFDPSRLCLQQLAENNVQLKQALDRIIDQYPELHQYLGCVRKGNTSRRSQLEFADNCYNSIKQALYALTLECLLAQFHIYCQAAILQADKVDAEKILERVSLIEHYQRWCISPARLSQLFDEVVDFEKLSHVKPPQPEYPDCPAADAFFAVRVVDSSKIESDKVELQHNQDFLEQHQISDNQGLRQYCLDQFGALESRPGSDMHSQFRWFPVTLAGGGAAVKLGWQFGSVALLIDLQHPQTLVPFSYKHNAYSNAIETHVFNYHRPDEVARDVQSNGHDGTDYLGMQSMLNKLGEIEARRRGSKADHNAAYYGLDKLKHNESFATFDPSMQAVHYICVDDTAESARQALRARVALGYPARPLVRYSPHRGFTPLSLETVADAARQLQPCKPRRTADKVVPSELTSLQWFEALKLTPDDDFGPRIYSSYEITGTVSEEQPLSFHFKHPKVVAMDCVVMVDKITKRPTITFFQNETLCGSVIHHNVARDILQQYHWQQQELVNRALLRNRRFMDKFQARYPFIHLKSVKLKDFGDGVFYRPFQLKLKAKSLLQQHVGERPWVIESLDSVLLFKKHSPAVEFTVGAIVDEQEEYDLDDVTQLYGLHDQLCRLVEMETKGPSQRTHSLLAPPRVKC